LPTLAATSASTIKPGNDSGTRMALATARTISAMSGGMASVGKAAGLSAASSASGNTTWGLET
jgi:hypothetical protein